MRAPRVSVVCSCGFRGQQIAPGRPCARCGKPLTLAPKLRAPKVKGGRVRMVIRLPPEIRALWSSKAVAQLLENTQPPEER